MAYLSPLGLSNNFVQRQKANLADSEKNGTHRYFPQ
jgi:hypothetical protein